MASVSTGVIIPLYIDPSSKHWDTVIETKNVHPRVPIIIIVNPNDGPGRNINESYVEIIKRLQSAGIIVLGYVATDHGQRSSSTVIDHIDKYKEWYAIDGILFDEMSNAPGKESYYKKLNNYAKSKELTLTVGNPGTEVPETYVGSVDNIITFESPGLPSLEDLDRWHLVHNKKFSVTGYNVDNLNQSYVRSAANYAGYVYITNDDLPNPWNSLPPYFGDLVEMLDR